MSRFEKLIASDSSFGLQVAALQVPLRLREHKRAVTHAEKLLAKLNRKSPTTSQIPHISLPLNVLTSRDPEKIIRDETTNLSSSRRALADFWAGHLRLSKNDAEGAVSAFESCANSNVLYTYRYWAECLAIQLSKNKDWPVP